MGGETIIIIYMEGKIFKVATFNVNSIRSRIHIIKRWLVKNSPDVLCLQETKVEDSLFPVEEIKNIGYNSVYRGEKRYNGVAILSSMNIEDVEYGFDNQMDGTRFIKAIINGITIMNVYVPQGKSIEHPDYKYKLRWFDGLIDYLTRNFSPEDMILLMGDMNVAPTEIDVTNPRSKLKHVCFHEKVREKFYKLLDWGFVDVFRKHKPEPGEFTFWDYRVKNALKRNIGWRVDHILATRPLAEKSINSYIDREPRAWEKPSDHTFLVAEFRL